MRDKTTPQEIKQTNKQGLLARLKQYFFEEEFADLQVDLTEDNKQILRKFRDSE